MKYLLTIIFTLTILTAQEGEVTNVVAEQRTDGSHIVDISYDLLPDSQFPSFTVFAYISIDAGETFESFDINNNLFPNVLGDNVLPGIGKSFYWDHIQDYDEISSDNIIFKISAYGHIALELPDSFEMIEIAAGDYMGYYYNYPSGNYNTAISHDDGFDTLMTVGYNYEMMKYPVTNAQFCTFLLDIFDQGLIGAPSWQYSCGDGVAYDYSESTNTYQIPNPPNYPSCLFILPIPDTPSSDNGRIYWNGETYLVEEGYANHPVQRVYTHGMELFAEYYGLRLPTVHEFIKAFRGMESYDYINQTYQEDAPPGAGFDGNFNGIFNFRDSGDTWELDHNGLNTTPVNYYDGSPYGDFQTNDSYSEYGLYDMQGNLQEVVTVDAGCHESSSSWGLCNTNEDGNRMVNSLGIPTFKPYLYNQASYETGNWNAWDTGQYSIHAWYSINPSEYRLRGFRCARTINSDN